MQSCMGVDLGNVIIDHMKFGTTPDYINSGDYNLIPPVDGVFDALRILNNTKFPNSIFVLYNATDTADQKIMSWLMFHDFFAKTSISLEKVIRASSGRNKFYECKKYKATHFIDDRLEVLSSLIGKVKNLYLFRPQQSEIDLYKNSLVYVQQISSWAEMIFLLEG